MGKVIDLKIKNRTYYFYYDLINIKNFDPKLLKLEKKSLEDISFYYIGYVIKKEECKINSVNPLYLVIHRVNGFLEEKNKNKYLNITSTGSDNEVLKKYEEVWSGIKDCIAKINNNKLEIYAKDYMKIKFNSDDDLPLNKQVKILSMTIIIRNTFERDGEYYPGIFLDECLYQV